MTAIFPTVSVLGSMDIKPEMIYRDDDVLLVKSEPQLYSPTNGTITVGSLLSGSSNGLVGTSSALSQSNGIVVSSNGAGAFSAFANAVVQPPKNRQTRTEDFLSSPSPGTMSGNNAPPLTPSPGPPSQAYTVISNGYSSPMSSGSYDPYSPNGKIGMYHFNS